MFLRFAFQHAAADNRVACGIGKERNAVFAQGFGLFFGCLRLVSSMISSRVKKVLVMFPLSNNNLDDGLLAVHFFQPVQIL